MVNLHQRKAMRINSFQNRKFFIEYKEYLHSIYYRMFPKTVDLNAVSRRIAMVEERNNIMSICAQYITRQMKTLHSQNDRWLADMQKQISDFEKECAEKSIAGKK